MHVLVKGIVCNEAFEKLLAEHLQERGMKLLELKEKHLKDAFKDATYDYSETEVESSAVHEYPPELENIDKSPTDYNNEGDKAKDEWYEKEFECTEGLEVCVAKSSGWSIGSGLSAEYQGIGATANVVYTKTQSETVTKFKSKVQKQKITKEITVPPKCCISVLLVRQTQRKECPVKNVKVSFSKNAKIKCAFHDNRDTKENSKTKEKFNIKDGLKDHMEDTAGGNRLTAKLEGKYVWAETSVYVDVGDAKPIHKI